MFDDQPTNQNQSNNNAGGMPASAPRSDSGRRRGDPPLPPRRPAFSPQSGTSAGSPLAETSDKKQATSGEGFAFSPRPVPPVSPAPSGLTPPAPQREARMSQEVEDIVGEIDAVEPMVKGPAVRPSIVPGPSPAAPAAVSDKRPAFAFQASAGRQAARDKEPLLSRSKKVNIMLGVVVLAGGAMAAGGWYGYQLLTKPKLVNTNINTNLNANANANLNTNTNTNLNTNAGGEVNLNTNMPPPEPLDTDRDGLTDEEEALYGTDINNADTDNDTLTDRDEAKVFKTDPNNADTDGDTYLDGAEVRAGYDPKGPGKLLEI